jgi:hypothetical protein
MALPAIRLLGIHLGFARCLPAGSMAQGLCNCFVRAAGFYAACSLGALVNVSFADFLHKAGLAWYLAGICGLAVGYYVGLELCCEYRPDVATRSPGIEMTSSRALPPAYIKS